MSVFFDTSVLVYGQLKGVKADRARTLLGAGGLVSVQVLNEFISVLSRKLRLGRTSRRRGATCSMSWIRRLP